LALPRIALVGFSGTGKSLIARILARKLGWASVDSDYEIARREGMSVPDLFESRGEEAFRKVEGEVLAEHCQRRHVVLATGGGAILSLSNRRLLAACYVVSLEASAAKIYERLSRNEISLAQRPLLHGADPLERITQLKLFRAPFYALADLSVDTEGQTPDGTADLIRMAWQTSPSGLEQDERRLARLLSAPSAQEASVPYARHSTGQQN
jgi:shikimate kinase